VAIAQALLEALVDAGARVAITTHYIQLKELAQNDRRFTVGAMEVSHIPSSRTSMNRKV
jgi:DNA mismatch repair protein MutS2